MWKWARESPEKIGNHYLSQLGVRTPYILQATIDGFLESSWKTTQGISLLTKGRGRHETSNIQDSRILKSYQSFSPSLLFFSYFFLVREGCPWFRLPYLRISQVKRCNPQDLYTLKEGRWLCAESQGLNPSSHFYRVMVFKRLSIYFQSYPIEMLQETILSKVLFISVIYTKVRG